MRRRVGITGLGAVTGLGIGAGALWEGLLEGRSALKRIARFDPSGFPCRIAAEVAPDFRVQDFVPKSYRKATKVMARDIELAVAAAKCAVQDARLTTKGVMEEGETPSYAPDRVGCQIGAGLIACETEELTRALATARGGAAEEPGGFDIGAWGEVGMNNLTPLWLLKYLPNMLACHVTILHDAQGPSNTITCSEASGLLSIGESIRVIERGDADLCFSGGAESKVNLMGLLRLDFAGRMAHTGDGDEGPAYLKPYDTDSAGSLLGEIGGIVILEAMETAEGRGARAYAEVKGFGAAQSPLDPDPTKRARGLRHAIDTALADAGLNAEAIDAIAPHASGAPAIDAEEAHALRDVFGERIKDIPLITVTPNIGEGMAGAGGAAVCAAAMALRHQTLPARVNLGSPAAGLRAGAAGAQDARIQHILVCTNALGGHNAALVLSST